MEKLIWTDPQAGTEHPITRITDVSVDGRFIGTFTHGLNGAVRGVFWLKDCRTA
jgi:hypothetical protein